jgi:protein SCO1/2
MRLRAVILSVAVSFAASVADSQTLSPDQIGRVDFEQRLGASLPVNAVFRDEAGAPVTLGHFFGERPVVLAMAYYECPNLCTVVLNGMLESLRNVRQDVGRDFDVIVVSINPSDTSHLAAEKKHTYSTRYGRPGSAKGWHFLTGDAQAIRQLADAVGFHYVYEPQSKQYAHASGIVVVTPEGKVSRYFLGIEYPPKEIRQALLQASQSRIGSLTSRLLLLCFHYDPHSGRYTLIVTRVMQIAGMGTAGLLGLLIVRMARHERKREGAP